MGKPLMSKTQNICLILLSILFLCLGVIMINHVLNSDDNKNETDYNEVEVNNEVIDKAMLAWEHSLCGNIRDLVNIMYSDSFNVENIDKYLLLYLSLETFDTIPSCTLARETVQITLAEINKKLNNIIDTKIELTSGDINNIISEGKLKQIYDMSFDNNSLTVAKTCDECENNHEGIIINNVKAKQNETKLVVYQKLAYGIETILETNDLVIDYYKDLNKKYYVERLSQVDAGKLSWDKYDTYKFTFSIDGDNYKLNSIKKIN